MQQNAQAFWQRVSLTWGTPSILALHSLTLLPAWPLLLLQLLIAGDIWVLGGMVPAAGMLGMASTGI